MRNIACTQNSYKWIKKTETKTEEKKTRNIEKTGTHTFWERPHKWLTPWHSFSFSFIFSSFYSRDFSHIMHLDYSFPSSSPPSSSPLALPSRPHSLSTSQASPIGTQLLVPWYHLLCLASARGTWAWKHAIKYQCSDYYNEIVRHTSSVTKEPFAFQALWNSGKLINFSAGKKISNPFIFLTRCALWTS